MSDNERTFPVQNDINNRSTVPHFFAEEVYKEYKLLYGSDQSLERIGQRGGFGAIEMVSLLVNRCLRLEAK